MKSAWILSGLLLTSVLATPTAAKADCRRAFKNDTPHTIFLSYGYFRRDNGWFCSGGTVCGSSFKVTGWWVIPANETVVAGSYPEEQLSEYFFAFSDAGHEWSAGGSWGTCLSLSTTHSMCVDADPPPASCSQGERRATYRSIDFYDGCSVHACLLGNPTTTLTL